MYFLHKAINNILCFTNKALMYIFKPGLSPLAKRCEVLNGDWVIMNDWWSRRCRVSNCWVHRVRIGGCVGCLAGHNGSVSVKWVCGRQ